MKCPMQMFYHLSSVTIAKQDSNGQVCWTQLRDGPSLNLFDLIYTLYCSKKQPNFISFNPKKCNALKIMFNTLYAI